MILVHTSFVSGVTGRPGIGNYTSRLEIGVSVFFVISGFLLYRPFALAHFGGGTLTPTRKFWVRRLKRIVPAYWVAFFVITYLMHGDTIRHGWGSLAIYLGFAQIYIPSLSLSGITQAWSLCTEMSFYLTLPLWAMLIRRTGRRRRAEPTTADTLRVELTGLAVLVLISVVYRSIVLQTSGQLPLTMPNWLPGYTDLFALGMLLAVVSSWLAVEDRRPAWLWHPAMPWVSWALAVVAFVAVSNIGLPITPVTPSPVGLSLERQTLYGLFAFFIVAPAVLGAQDRGIIRRALQWRLVAWTGVVSYGIYLWHETWIAMMLRWTGDQPFGIGFLALTLPVAALAIVSATLSYRLVERPFRLLGRNRRVAPVIRPKLAGLAVKP